MKSLEIVNDLIEFNSRNCITFNNKIAQDLIKVKQDLEVLEIFRKHIELEKEDSDPYDECAFYEDVLYMNLNLEQDISSDEYEKIKQWLEEKE